MYMVSSKYNTYVGLIFFLFFFVVAKFAIFLALVWLVLFFVLFFYVFCFSACPSLLISLPSPTKTFSPLRRHKTGFGCSRSYASDGPGPSRLRF